LSDAENELRAGFSIPCDDRCAILPSEILWIALEQLGYVRHLFHSMRWVKSFSSSYNLLYFSLYLLSDVLFNSFDVSDNDFPNYFAGTEAAVKRTKALEVPFTEVQCDLFELIALSTAHFIPF
jgi:hypothetical protein